MVPLSATCLALQAPQAIKQIITRRFSRFKGIASPAVARRKLPTSTPPTQLLLFERLLYISQAKPTVHLQLDITPLSPASRTFASDSPRAWQDDLVSALPRISERTLGLGNSTSGMRAIHAARRAVHAGQRGERIGSDAVCAILYLFSNRALQRASCPLIHCNFMHRFRHACPVTFRLHASHCVHACAHRQIHTARIRDLPQRTAASGI